MFKFFPADEPYALDAELGVKISCPRTHKEPDPALFVKYEVIGRRLGFYFLAKEIVELRPYIDVNGQNLEAYSAVRYIILEYTPDGYNLRERISFVLFGLTEEVISDDDYRNCLTILVDGTFALFSRGGRSLKLIPDFCVVVGVEK